MEISLNDSYLEFLECEQRYAVLIGGAGSGKSVSVTQKLLIRVLTEKGHRFLLLRKVKATLRNSVFQLLRDMIAEYNLSDQFKVNKSEMSFLHLPTGNEILLGGMDDPEKIKSVAGITGIWCEEATEFEEDDFNQLELRIRGEKAFYVQFILSLNPIREDHWIKERFFDREDSEVYRLKTTYKDNHFLDAQYIKHLESRVAHNEQLYRVYVLGEWGAITVGMEFYKSFQLSKHITDVRYDASKPLFLSFDENVHPYISCLVSQIDGKTVNIIDEICLPDPRNTVEQVCKEIELRYPINSGMYICGDRTSKKEDVKLEKGQNFFNLILGYLDKYKPILRLPKRNPPVQMRGRFINAIFANNYEGIKVNIDTKCQKLKNDLLYVKEAQDGGKHKAKKKDKNTGVTFEEYGHTSDCLDYLICEVFKNEFQMYTNGGKPQFIKTVQRNAIPKRSRL